MQEPEAFILFCDDTRAELGNKLSIMGVFGPKALIEIGPNDADPVVLRGVTVCALCRFRDGNSRRGTLQVTFEGGGPDFPFPAELPPAEFEIFAANETEWTTNLIGAFPNVPAIDGLVITASLDIGDLQRSASLEFSVSRTTPPTT